MQSLATQESAMHKGNLKKKTGKNCWQLFCVVLQGNRLMFFNPGDGSLAGNIEIHEGSRCDLFLKGSRIGPDIQDPTMNTEIAELNKRRQRGENLKFSLHTRRGIHFLKADSEALCLEWIRELRKAVLIIREVLSKQSPGKNCRRALDQGNNNQICNNLYVYQAVETENCESEEKESSGKRSRSRSCHEAREFAFDFIRRSRFRSFRKLSRNYENLKDNYS